MFTIRAKLGLTPQLDVGPYAFALRLLLSKSSAFDATFAMLPNVRKHHCFPSVNMHCSTEPGNEAIIIHTCCFQNKTIQCQAEYRQCTIDASNCCIIARSQRTSALTRRATVTTYVASSPTCDKHPTCADATPNCQRKPSRASPR